MLKISRLADYAVLVMSGLARKPGLHRSAPDLAAETGIPEPTVAKVLKILTREGLLESARGTNGGYKLLNQAPEITIGAIIAAVDGPITLTACTEGSHDDCTLKGRCALAGRWNPVNQALRTALEGVTLADMMRPLTTQVKARLPGSHLVFRPAQGE